MENWSRFRRKLQEWLETWKVLFTVAAQRNLIYLDFLKSQGKETIVVYNPLHSEVLAEVRRCFKKPKQNRTK